MNSKQLRVLLLGVLLFALSELFPPWQYKDGWTSAEQSAGYHFLYSPPEVKSDDEMKKIFSISDHEPVAHYIRVRIDKGRLFGQRIALVSLPLGLLLLLKERRSAIAFVLGGLLLLVGLASLALASFLFL